MDAAAPRPTLLVFTLGAAGECARRRLLPAAKELELELHRSCLEAALEAGRACGLRLRVSSPRPLPLADDVEAVPQAGCGFGDRLRRAARGAFEDGAAPVVMVGTDVPGLAAGHVRRALGELRRDAERVVVGPSPDGGFYLLAAARPVDEILSQVRWCRRDTLRSLLAALRRAGRPVALLDPLADLDRRPDLERWLAADAALATPAWRALLAALRRALARLCRPLFPPASPLPPPAPVPVRAGRAPPRRPRR